MRKGSCWLAAVGALVALSGCPGGEHDGTSVGAARPRGAAGGEEGLDGDDEDEVRGVLTLLAARPFATEAPPRWDDRIGVRVGLLVTVVSEEGDWEPAGVAGLCYSRLSLQPGRASYELAIDYTTVDRADGAVSSDQYVVRAATLLGSRSAAGGSPRKYLLAGGSSIYVDSTWHSTGKTATSSAGGVELGFGVAGSTGRWDARVVYSAFPGSRNVGGSILTAFALSY